MGTKTSTTQATQYDPTTYAQRQSLMGPMQAWSQYAQNPFSTPAFNVWLNQANQRALQSGQQGMSNLMGNLGQGAYGNVPGFMTSQMANLGRQTSAMQAQAYQSAITNALQQQMQFGNLLNQVPSLQTGQTQTQQTSGLGTWLPQLASLGLGLASGGLFGGAAGLGGLFGPGGSLTNQMPSYYPQGGYGLSMPSPGFGSAANFGGMTQGLPTGVSPSIQWSPGLSGPG